MKHRNLLLILIGFFTLFWFVLPNVLPQTGRPIYFATMPFRHIGVFVHEMGHGLFTLLSGGRFYWFQMELMQGGVAVTSGGIRAVTLLGGLLGPALLGGVLLQVSTRAKNLRFAHWFLITFFVIGIFYMIKPLFLPQSRYPLLAQWEFLMLLSLVVPVGMVFINLKVMNMSDRLQRMYLQTLGILLCYSAYSDTGYIFYYDQLPNGLYSDVRVLAGLFWPGGPENVSYPVFIMMAVLVSIINFAIMGWGVWRALRVKNVDAKPEKRGFSTTG